MEGECPGSLAYSVPSLLYIVPSSGMKQKSFWNDGLMNHQARKDNVFIYGQLSHGKVVKN